MLDIIRAYCNLKITALNSSLTTDLTETTVSLDLDNLPANQLNNYYQIRLDSYKLEDAKESKTLYSADVSIKFSFGLYNKDVTHYTTIVDDYIHSLMRMFKANNSGGARLPYTSSGVYISKIEDLEASGLKEITNNFLQPEIKFKALVLDNNNVSLTPPSAPTLTSPTNGYSTGLTDQSFNWTGTADSWEIKISTGSTIVIQQAGLGVSSFTVPNDSLLTNGTLYNWTVRGFNEAGYGDWATAFTFTVNDTVVTAKTPLEVGLDDIWVRGDDITLSGSNVSSWNDKSGNSRHLINTTTGNRPITETLSGKTFVKFEGTSATSKQLNYNDSAHVFKMTGTQTRTFFFILYTRTNTANWIQTILNRSNNNVGDEWLFRMRLTGYNFYGFPKGDLGANEAILPEQLTTVRRVLIEVQGTNVKVYVNNTLINDATVSFIADPSLPATTATYLILGSGRVTGSGGTFAGAIGEFASGDVALSTDNKNSLDKYAQDYYGL